MVTNYQKSIMQNMNEGDTTVASWPQPNGNIYLKTLEGKNDKKI